MEIKFCNKSAIFATPKNYSQSKSQIAFRGTSDSPQTGKIGEDTLPEGHRWGSLCHNPTQREVFIKADALVQATQEFVEAAQEANMRTKTNPYCMSPEVLREIQATVQDNLAAVNASLLDMALRRPVPRAPQQETQSHYNYHATPADKQLEVKA